MAPEAGTGDHPALCVRNRPPGTDSRPRCAPAGTAALLRRQRQEVGPVDAAGKSGPGPRVAVPRAPVGHLHAPLGLELRGVQGPADHLPGRVLPVRLRLPGRLPRPAPAHPPGDLLRPGTRPGRAALLGVRAAARRRADPLCDVLALSPGRRPRQRQRHGPVAAVVRGRVRAGHPRHGCLRQARAVQRRRDRDALASPPAGVRPPGVPARAARRLSDPRRGRLVRLLHGVSPDDGVEPRVRPARLCVPAHGRARRPARGSAVRPGTSDRRGAKPRGHAPRVDRRRLVLAGLRGRAPDRPWGDIRRAPAVGDPRRSAARRPGPDAGAERPPLPHRGGRTRGGPGAGAHRLLPVARFE